MHAITQIWVQYTKNSSRTCHLFNTHTTIPFTITLYVDTMPFVSDNNSRLRRAENMYVRMDMMICGPCMLSNCISNTVYNGRCDANGLVSGRSWAHLHAFVKKIFFCFTGLKIDVFFGSFCVICLRFPSFFVHKHLSPLSSRMHCLRHLLHFVQCFLWLPL